MRAIQEFLLSLIVGFGLWLFIIALLPIPRYVSPPRHAMDSPGETAWEPVVIWGGRDRETVMITSLAACLVGLPLGVMAIRRLRRL